MVPFILLFFTQSAGAQDVRVITFEEAVEIALDQNSALQQARNAAALDAVSTRSQYMQFFPNLSMSSGGTQTYGRSFNQDEGRILTEATRSFSSRISSSVTLFSGFANVAYLEQARLNEQASSLDLERARQTVIFQVISGYLSLIELREQVLVRQESMTSQEEQEAQVSDYIEAGMRPISDLYQQQANVASARLTLLEAQRALEIAKVDLIQILKLDPFGSYEFIAPEVGESLPEQQMYDLNVLLGNAFSQRADLTAGEARLQASEQNVRAVMGGYLPSLSFQAQYSSNFSSASDITFMDQLDQRRMGSISLNLSIPLFDRFNKQINTERSRLQMENVRISLENLQQEVALQVRRAYLDYQAAQEQNNAAEAQVRAADLANQSAQERYEVGAGTLLELTQARVSQVQAASDLVSVRYNLLFQEQLLAFYLGVLNR